MTERTTRLLRNVIQTRVAEPRPHNHHSPISHLKPDWQSQAEYVRGPVAHHWIETEIPAGRVTIGFGPATLPFIDAGQIALQDGSGNVERISGMHPLPPLGLPPLNYRYSRAPGEGRVIGKPIALTMAHSEALVQHIRHQKFVVPYIPLFHDCRTFVCVTKAAAQGRSSLPRYLLFKGYW